jgi:preprotein translocase subunit SecD
MNRYPAWLNWLVLIIVIAGSLMALPNVFGDDPAIHIARTDGVALQDSVLPQIRTSLSTADISFISAALEEDAALIRFADISDQLAANDLLREAFSDHTVALTLAARTPGWLSALGMQPMNLGLDLRGGVHCRRS